MTATNVSSAIAVPLPAVPARDRRVDVIRGVCLLTIFFDHIPQDCVSNITFGNYGFSDAAEMFVFLAGFSAASAHGGLFDPGGWHQGTWRVVRRCLRLWGAHVGLILCSAGLVWTWQALARPDFSWPEPILLAGWGGLLQGLNLEALPRFLDILPLYILLTLMVPLLLAGLRRSPAGTLGLSSLVYAAANLLHCNIPNRIDNSGVTFWMFNPFTWQVLFVLGAAFARGQRGGPAVLPLRPAMVVLCWVYLAYALLCTVAWRWGVLSPANRESYSLFGNDPKSFLTTWRLTHALALAAVLFASPRFLRLCQAPATRLLAVCGRHALPVFWVGCLLSLLGRLAFHDFGHGVLVQVIVNVTGLTTMLVLAEALDVRRVSQKRGSPEPSPVQGAVACLVS